MTKQRRKGCGGCGGCGLLLLILLVVALIWAAVVPFRILQRTGLQESPAERLLGGPPDRKAADTLVNALQGAGMSMQGVQVQVLELSNTGERVVFTVLDASKGFDPQRPLDGDSATDMLPDLAAAVAGLDVDRIAVYYVGADGDPLFTVTHRVDAIQALEQGTITDEEFLEGLGVDFDIWQILGEGAQ
ncbi:MAG TPA: hypothetical protein VMY98_04860 [Anaerolineae bacterium]|nr:hypothetical protein [Anaerolineae bacterium]